MEDEIPFAQQMGVDESDHAQPDVDFRLYFGIFLFFPLGVTICEGLKHVTLKDLIVFSIVGLVAAVFAHMVNE